MSHPGRRGLSGATQAQQPTRRSVDASGPVLALCTGHRCSGLRRLAGTEDTVEDLRKAVRDTTGAVLITANCIGPCSLASLVAVARRDGSTGRTGPTVWLGGMEERARADVLRQWIGIGGPARIDRPSADLPAALRAAMVGLGPGHRMTRHEPPC